MDQRAVGSPELLFTECHRRHQCRWRMWKLFAWFFKKLPARQTHDGLATYLIQLILGLSYYRALDTPLADALCRECCRELAS